MKATLKNSAAAAAIALVLGFAFVSCGDTEGIYDAKTFTGLWYSCDAKGKIDAEPATLTISVAMAAG